MVDPEKPYYRKQCVTVIVGSLIALLGVELDMMSQRGAILFAVGVMMIGAALVGPRLYED